LYKNKNKKNMPKNDEYHQSDDIHKPVLLKEVLEYLQPEDGSTYLDVTAGYGGHAEAVMSAGKAQKAVLVDRDQNAIKFLRQKFESDTVEIIHKDFLAASEGLAQKGQHFDMILADLGVSSPHLNDASRGFSVRNDGPLDMRMDQTQELTAEFIVNNWSEEQLSNALSLYGEEPKAQTIARKIIAGRPIRTTIELAAIVKSAWPGHSKIHPATRTFQALRIAVNSELAQLEKALPIWIDLLNPDGRLVVISFHSLEDRIVKNFLNEHARGGYDSDTILLTKKPVTAGQNEIVSNPRARSAKLRAGRKK
jgi:16S rRNA (cytosine1402-N4)-methyltransferase